MKETKPACRERHFTITAAQLPLCCPMPDQILWDAHPRVYLPIEDKGGHITCPYCETKYTLVTGDDH